MNPRTFTQPPGFFKTHVLPLLLVLAIPAFSAWFFQSAENRFDAEVLRSIERSVREARDLTPEQKSAEIAFFRALPASEILASDDPELAELRNMLASSKNDYATFRWMKRIAWACLITAVATLVIVGISVAFSFRSQASQYAALSIGWPVLRMSALIQVTGQAVLAVALSYWVTALWFEIYVIKLIAVIGILALIALTALLKAIFRKIDDRHEISGEPISEPDAPELWGRIRAIAETLKTTPPDQIIGGIEPTFFVTEQPVELDGKRLHGRTLFVSLPMLKTMSVEEADAVLGHELAHFSGQDTLWSRKIGPLMNKFAIYLQALYSGLTVPIARFMHYFWNLYSVSIGRLSRAREFRADSIGASVVSSAAMARALIKVSSYCDYRANTEQGIIEKPRVADQLDLSAQLETGFPAFLSAVVAGKKAMDAEITHPFDSHPPLIDRVRELGIDPGAAVADAALLRTPNRTWSDAIFPAGEMEARMWAKREEQIQAYHGMAIAYRVLPTTDEEIAMVEKLFPRLVLHDKKGNSASLDYRSVGLSTWASAIPFSHISSIALDDSIGKKRLVITHMPEGAAKAITVKFHPTDFVFEKGNLLDMIQSYYGRHEHARSGASS